MVSSFPAAYPGRPRIFGDRLGKMQPGTAAGRERLLNAFLTLRCDALTRSLWAVPYNGRNKCQEAGYARASAGEKILLLPDHNIGLSGRHPDRNAFADAARFRYKILDRPERDRRRAQGTRPRACPVQIHCGGPRGNDRPHGQFPFGLLLHVLIAGRRGADR